MFDVYFVPAEGRPDRRCVPGEIEPRTSGLQRQYSPGLFDVDDLPGKIVYDISGFDSRIAPRANLIRKVDSVVYGILATATQAELDRLCTDHAKGVLGET